MYEHPGCLCVDHKLKHRQYDFNVSFSIPGYTIKAYNVFKKKEKIKISPCES